MRKFIITVLILTILSVSAFATEGLLIAPNPNAAEMTPEAQAEREFLVSLHKGIIPITDDMTYEDFLDYMMIIDNSDARMYTSKFETFVSLIEYYYYGKLTQEDIFSRFASSVESVDINDMEPTYKALFSVLDKFSYYLTPDEAKSFFTPTASKGAGVMMTWHEAEGDLPSGIYVDQVANGSPAEMAGIKAGDRIVGFNDHDLRGLGFQTLGVYISLIPDEEETLTITYVRDSESKEEKSCTLLRVENLFDEYKITLYPQKRLVYLDIDSFMYEQTALDIAEELDIAHAKGYNNIIIDLQDNSGGDVYVAAAIASKFTPNEELLFAMGRDGKTNSIPFYSTGIGHSFERISILVNEHTASSAEIFAQTLRKMSGARLFGTRTFGKGVAQSVFTFEDGASCGVTTYVAYDREGKTYNEVGLIPDTTVIAEVAKNSLPADTPSFTLLNYEKAVEGASNEVVRGLEIRLEAIGFLADSEVDTSWTDATTRALEAFQIYNGFESTGELDKETYLAIMSFVKDFEQSYYFTYTPFDYVYRFMPNA